jgi:hypothetical protein
MPNQPKTKKPKWVARLERVFRGRDAARQTPGPVSRAVDRPRDTVKETPRAISTNSATVSPPGIYRPLDFDDLNELRVTKPEVHPAPILEIAHGTSSGTTIQNQSNFGLAIAPATQPAIPTIPTPREEQSPEIYVEMQHSPAIAISEPSSNSAIEVLTVNNPKTGEAIVQSNRRLVIRVITPASAQRGHDNHGPLLYNDGKPIPLNTTLRQLKVGISQLLNVQGLRLPSKATAANVSHICNCDFGRSIVESGLWEMLRCRVHDSREGACDYPHSPVQKGTSCIICHIALTDPCEGCEDSTLDGCPLVVNAGCNHTFHHHCYRGTSNETCPGGCGRSMSSGSQF